MTSQRFDTESAWLAARGDTIGASDVPSLFGVVAPRMDPSTARERLIEEKATGIRKPKSAKSKQRMQAGKVLEAYGLNLLATHLGKMVAPCGWTIYRSPEFPFLAATPDAIVDGVEGAECKVLGPDALAPEWGDFTGYQGRWQWVKEAPLRVSLQATAQMMAAGLPRVHVIAVAGSDHNVWTVERDEEVIALIADAVTEAIFEIQTRRDAATKESA